MTTIFMSGPPSDLRSRLGGDSEQDYFIDGVVEDIISALSRNRWLFVIARNSSFTYKDRAVDVKRVGRALGVRYVLEGSMRKAARRVRITGQLTDATTGAHIWAERFEGTLDDIFELQDQVAASVVGAVGPQLERAEIERLARAMRLSPLDPEMVRMQTGTALAHLLAGRFDAASAWAEQAFGDLPSFLLAVGIIAASRALAGREGEARQGLDPAPPAGGSRDACGRPETGGPAGAKVERAPLPPRGGRRS